MNVLVVNAGSSSLKYQLFDTESSTVLAKGNCERIGIDGKLTHKSANGVLESEIPMPAHDAAIRAVLDALTDKTYGCISDLSEISAIGHRVVHGGEQYKASTYITPEVMGFLDTLVALAPLHEPANITGIKACEAVMPARVPS